MLATLLVGAFFSAMLIQSDSPYRSDAFWLGKPLFRSAVVAAKALVVVTCGIGIPLVAHAVILIAGYRAVPPAISEQIVGSGLYAGVWISGAVLLAAITPNLSSFFLVLVAQFVGMNSIALLLAKTGFDPERYFSAEGPVTNITSIFFALLALAWTYHARNRTHGVVLAVASIFIPMLLAFGIHRTETEAYEDSSLPAAETAGELRIVEFPGRRQNTAAIRDGSNRENQIAVLVQLRNFDPSRTYQLIVGAAELLYRDGRSEPLTVLRETIHLNHAVPKVGNAAWILPEMSVLRQPYVSRSYSTPLRLVMTEGQERAVRTSGASLIVLGRIDVSQLVPVLMIPLETGSGASAEGERLEILAVEPAAGQVTVTLRGIDVSVDPVREQLSFEPEFAILNRARAELVQLPNYHGTGGTFGVLPSPFDNQSYRRELTRSERDGAPEIPPGWYEGAELVRFRRKEIGSYPIRVEMTGMPAGFRAHQ